jgi:hypothetical protein
MRVKNSWRKMACKSVKDRWPIVGASSTSNLQAIFGAFYSDMPKRVSGRIAGTLTGTPYRTRRAPLARFSLSGRNLLRLHFPRAGFFLEAA